MTLLNKNQKEILNKIKGLSRNFYVTNDNPYTYALTGLLYELSNAENYISKKYIKEKINIIIDYCEQLNRESDEPD